MIPTTNPSAEPGEAHLGSDPRTRTYVARRFDEGRSRPEIIRILKRYVARETYQHLPR
jgi:hypothetical protein